MRTERKRQTEGRVVDVPVISLVRGDMWWPIAGEIKKVVLPERPPLPQPRRVPKRLAHHFWNADPARLRLPDDSDYVAGRLLLSNDPQAVSWAAQSLGAASVRRLARTRGVKEHGRGWLDNLAGAKS